MAGGSGLTRVGVVGSGIMGAGIVEVVALAGFEVIVRARTEEGAAAVVAQVVSRLQRSVDKGRLEATEADATVSRISHTSHLGELAACELVLETVIEDLEVKRRLVSELDDLLDPAAILATNTSTLPVVELAVATTRTDRVCGLHFFNPATAMPLVEIVTPVTVAESTIALVERFAADCGKESIRVADRGERVALPLFECRDRPRRTRRGQPSRRRPSHAGRLQLPDGAIRAARPHRPRYDAPDS